MLLMMNNDIWTNAEVSQIEMMGGQDIRMVVTVQLIIALIEPTFLNKHRARVFKSAPGSSLPMYSIPDNQCSRFETDFCSSSPHIGSHAELCGVAPATSYISHRLPVEATYLTADYEVYLAITLLKELTAHLHQDES